jgi:predicted AAA+ superfamily ATPase
VRTRGDLLAQPWVGASWEGFVLQQVVGTLTARGHAVEPHWFRTADGMEIDLVFELGGHLWAVETKLTSAPSDEDLARLDRAADLIGADRRILVAQVREAAVRDGRGVAPLPGLLRLLERAAR